MAPLHAFNPITVFLRDAFDNEFPVQLVSIGGSGPHGGSAAAVYLPNTVVFDQYGDPLLVENNPGVIGQVQTVVAASFTRPANTTTYASGQLIANSVTAGSVVPMSLSVGRILGGTCTINRARLTKSGTTTTLATFRAHLYKTLPTPSNGDGGVWLTNQALAYLGSFTFDMTGTASRVFTDGAKTVAAPDVGTVQIVDTGTTSNVIYALLEARASYVPASAEVFTLALELTQN